MDADELIDDALTWLTVNDKTEWNNRSSRIMAGRRELDTGTLLLVPRSGEIEVPGADWKIPMGLHPKAWFRLAHHTNVKTMLSPGVSLLVRSDGEEDEPGYFIRQYQPIKRDSSAWRRIRSDARGHYTLEWRHFLLEEGGTKLGVVGSTVWNGKGWETAYMGDAGDPEGYSDIVNGWADLACGFYVSSLSWWFVDFAYEGTPFISLKTDPVGAREAFRLRDIPAGRGRRTALRHWVKEHWRRQRTDATEESRIRSHLRGAETFNWNGLRCRIRPSLSDQLRASE